MTFYIIDVLYIVIILHFKGRQNSDLTLKMSKKYCFNQNIKPDENILIDFYTTEEIHEINAHAVLKI